MVSADEFLSVLDDIYDAPLKTNGWANALLSISTVLRAEGSTYSGSHSDRLDRKPVFFHADFENSKAIKEYCDYYYSICERSRLSMRERVGVVYYDYKYFTEADDVTAWASFPETALDHLRATLEPSEVVPYQRPVAIKSNGSSGQLANFQD